MTYFYSLVYLAPRKGGNEVSTMKLSSVGPVIPIIHDTMLQIARLRPNLSSI